MLGLDCGFPPPAILVLRQLSVPINHAHAIAVPTEGIRPYGMLPLLFRQPPATDVARFVHAIGSMTHTNDKRASIGKVTPTGCGLDVV